MKNNFLWFYAGIQFISLFAIKLILNIAGLFIVPVGLLFSVKQSSRSDGREIDNLPKWLWIFGNDSDGTYGDKRLWWDKNCDEQVLFGILPLIRKVYPKLPVLNSKNYLPRYWWTAVRNPSNNLRWVPIITCPVSKCKITYSGQYDVSDKLGKEGWQFVTATNDRSDYQWFGFYFVWKYPNTTHGLRIRFGYKIKPKDEYDPNAEDVGFAFSVLPWKDLT